MASAGFAPGEGTIPEEGFPGTPGRPSIEAVVEACFSFNTARIILYRCRAPEDKPGGVPPDEAASPLVAIGRGGQMFHDKKAIYVLRWGGGVGGLVNGTETFIFIILRSSVNHRGFKYGSQKSRFFREENNAQGGCRTKSRFPRFWSTLN